MVLKFVVVARILSKVNQAFDVVSPIAGWFVTTYKCALHRADKPHLVSSVRIECSTCYITFNQINSFRHDELYCVLSLEKSYGGCDHLGLLHLQRH